MKDFLKYEIKINKKKLYAGIGVTYIVLTAFLSRGQSFYIASDIPLEDIVSICHWSSSAFPGLHGGTHHVTRKKGVVVKSGEIASCGMNWYAGLTLSFKTYDTLKHPTHEFFYDKEREDGVSVVRAKSKLVLLDELKEKFESGYWDKYKWPESEYARNLVECGFPYKYFDYYSEVKKVDKEHFKKLFHDEILECKKRVFPIYNKYLSHEYSGKRPSPEESMNNLWNSKGWKKYK